MSVEKFDRFEPLTDDEFDELREIVTNARNDKPFSLERYHELVQRMRWSAEEAQSN